MRHLKKHTATGLFIFFSFSLLIGSNALGQSPSPTPTSRSVIVPSVSPTPTLTDLANNLRTRLFSQEARRARIGIKVISMNTGKVIFEQDSDKYFMPASNMKNFTVASAMEKLGPNFKFVTSVYAQSPIDAAGNLKGDLRIYGRGDVSISTAFFGTSPTDPETYYKGIDRLADKIVAAGVKRIEGSIVGDESYFKGDAIPETWEWDDLQTYYGTEISALPLNDNAVDVAVAAGTSGTACNVTVSPPNTIINVVNLCTSGGQNTLRVQKKLDQNIYLISGNLPAGSKWSGSLSVTRPAELFVAMLKERLQKRGIIVTGGSRVLPQNIKTSTNDIEIARLESAPFGVVAANTMKPSQNMFTETILWTLGEEIGRKSGGSGNSSQLGLGVVKGFLSSIGIPADGIVQYDGSGLSRHDLITPSAVTALYYYMGKQSLNSTAWRNSLTIAGIDGTLKNRLKGTLADGNLRGKTGTIDQVSALSGYLRTAGGEELAVSIVINGLPNSTTRVKLIDSMILDLATFSGRVDQ